MQTKTPRPTPGLKGKTLVVAVLSVAALTARAQTTTFFDDFESYADNAALNLVWLNNSSPASGSLPAGTPSDGLILTNSRSLLPPSTGTNSGATRWAHDRSYAVLPTGEIVAGTFDTPGSHALLTTHMWRNSISTTVGQTRTHTTVGASSSVSVVGIGWFNNATALINGTADVFDGNYYQGKHSGTGGNLFFNLKDPGTPRRTVGWHKFDIEMLTNGVTRYYVDNVLARTVTNAPFGWDIVAAGFGTTSAVPAGNGEEVDFDGIRVTTNSPTVIQQPTNLLVAAGTSPSFTVVATSPLSITGYQWYFATNLSTSTVFSTNYHALPGATNSTLTITNVASSNQGIYYVVVSNADSSIGSAAATLNITVPSILTQPPTNQNVLQGGNFSVSITAGGASPLSYQWFFGANPVAGATSNRLVLTNVQLTNQGNYTVRVTNAFGSATSSVTALTVITNPHPTAMTLLWSKLPNSFPWLNTDGTQRGLAYNALSNHVLIVSRTGGSLVHVLDGDTGAELYTLDPGIGTIAGGTFDVNAITVADDGAVYLGNLTLDGVSSHFKLYRYENDAPTTLPTVAFDDDPGAGITDRWGDSIDSRGAGAATQILLGARGNGAVGGGTNLSILTTSDGLNFVPNVLHVNTTNLSEFGLGVAFGKTNTIWAKSNDGTTRGLYHLSFDIPSNTATVLADYTNSVATGLPAVANIAVNQAGNLLAGIAIETPNDVRLYDITTLTSDPFLVDWEFFTANNSGQPTGAADFGNNRLYALNSNNGILALQIAWPPLNFSRSGSTLTLTWEGSYVLQSASTVTGPYSDVSTTSGYTYSGPGEQYFRLRAP